MTPDVWAGIVLVLLLGLAIALALAAYYGLNDGDDEL